MSTATEATTPRLKAQYREEVVPALRAQFDYSNVMLVDPESKRATRVGFRKEAVDKARADGTTYEVQRNVRVAKRTGEDI